MKLLRVKLVVLNILTALIITASLASIIPGVSDMIEVNPIHQDATSANSLILEA